MQELEMDAEELTRHPHYALVAQAIRYIWDHAEQQPRLGEIAAGVGLSEFHFQRLFTQWAGVSPKRYLQFLTKEHAKAALRRSADMLEAAQSAGLSGPGRLHDLIVTCEAVTPGDLKRGGQGLTISYGQIPTPFGEALVSWTDKGVCHLEFFTEGPGAALASLQRAWPNARLEREDAGAKALGDRMFGKARQPGPLPVWLRGTNFQLKVWEALLRVPSGCVISYAQLAGMAGLPGAQRAVGTAMAANTIAYLIPCHRVIRGDAVTGSYRWGSERKQIMLAWEAAQVESDQTDLRL